MGREDREYRRRHRLPPDPARGAPKPIESVSVPSNRLKAWLGALQAAQLERVELQRLRGEIGSMQEKVRRLSKRLEAFERGVDFGRPRG